MDMNKNNHPSLPLPDKDELNNLYHEEKKSTWSIAKIYGVSQMQIRRWLIKLEIRPRSYSEASKITRNSKFGPDHHMWQAEKVSYSAIHAWVTRHKGSPQKCEHCQTTEPRKYEWANIDHKYKRDLDDYIRLCTSCHRQYDIENNNL